MACWRLKVYAPGQKSLRFDHMFFIMGIDGPAHEEMNFGTSLQSNDKN